MRISHSPHLRSFIPLFLTLCFLFASCFAQLSYDGVRAKHFRLNAPVHKFVLPAPIVHHTAFGFRNILADYYWVTAIQDLNKWDRFDTYYPEYFRIISTLDPKFAYPYIMAALTVPSRKNPEESLGWLSVITERGMRALPLNWEIPFYTGVQYHAIEKSFERATHYMEIAAQTPDSPDVTRQAYGIYLLRGATDYQRSRALFTAIYETASNESSRVVAGEQIALLDLVETLNQGVITYKAIHHVLPRSVNALVDEGIVSVPAGVVEQHGITLDNQTGKVKFLQ